MKLSAAIITYNEEFNIERCVRSLIPIADEIIILDSFSTDNTPIICKNLPVVFHQRKWGGYTASKNFLNSLSTNQYILSIDADEVVDDELAKAIKVEKENGFNGVYSINRITNYIGVWIKHSGWYPDQKIKYFPNRLQNGKVILFMKNWYSLKTLKITCLQGHLEHYSYNSYDDHRKRADKYSALTAQKQFSEGKKASFLKPYMSAIGRFIAMYILKKGFLDGKMGFKIAVISAQSNIFKYKELRRLNRGKN